MRDLKKVRLFLAPMEGLGAIEFRRMMAVIQGFDECCTEFIRIPVNPNVEALVKNYNKDATSPIPQAAQLMGVNPEDLALAAKILSQMGALRIELNCGCPSNIVTGKGAGSSLLNTPDLLFEILQKMVKSSKAPVSAKLRIGVDDDRNFEKNVQLVEKAGCSMLTLHARTKADGYTHPARIDYIKRAKQLVSIPVCGNGDITSPKTALQMLELTNCDHLMVGRQAAKDPFIFHKIRAVLNNVEYTPNPDLLINGLNTFFDLILLRHNPMGPIKQLASYLLHDHPDQKKAFLTKQFEDPLEAKDTLFSLLGDSILIER